MTARRIGYALCLATDPADAVQETARLADLGCAAVHVDTGVTAPRGTHRPGLAAAFADCRAGGALVVTSLARLAPRLLDLQTVLAQLVERSVHLEADGVRFDWRTDAGTALVRDLTLLLDFDKRLNSLRSKEGRAASPRPLPTGGRPPALDPAADAQAQLLRDAGVPLAQIAAVFGVSPATVRRHTNS